MTQNSSMVNVIGRGPVYGANGMVATSQVAATQIGVDILRHGGTAVDAAIAANAALSVIEPHMCGLGGDLFAIVWDPAESASIGLNASGRSPQNSSLDELSVGLGLRTMPGRGVLPVTVPGAADGWCMLHDQYGGLTLAEVLEPAAQLARSGTPIGKRTANAWAGAAQALRADTSLNGLLDPFEQIYTNNGATPCAGETFRNPTLANTFEMLGNGGSAAFYEGEIAAHLIEYLQSTGSKLTADDLASTHAGWVSPIATKYRDVELFELPPNGQGMTVLQMMNLIEANGGDRLSRDDAAYWHLFLEAKKLSFEDRAQHYADPATYSAPIEQLISKEYAEARGQLIDSKRAGTDYRAGEVTVPGSDTTYLTVADKNGLMVSLIQSIFSPFGSGLVPPSLGFALQSRGAGFALDAGHPNCYAPGKRPFHTIIPAFACKSGKPWFSFGVMGADMQPQGQVQVLMNLIEFGLDPQAAGDAPRMRHDGGHQPNGAHLDGLGITQYEPGFDPMLIKNLESMGHKMVVQQAGMAGFTGGYQGILCDYEQGVYLGASESRLDGAALGY